jgi:DNA topoisomerase-1
MGAIDGGSRGRPAPDERSSGSIAHVPPAIEDGTREMDERDADDPALTAKHAGLRYVMDRRPGIQRKRVGKTFRYINVDGAPITAENELERIAKLSIPPAWTDVWISPVSNGHLQATGRDAKGRKQYRYHPKWTEVRNETKFHRMVAFGMILPEIRARIGRDLRLSGLQRERVLATVVQLMDETCIRVGNAEYARENNHYGLTTLEHEHVQVSGDILHFQFVGKAGQEREVDVRDRRVARIVKRMVNLPGYELFQYIDEGGDHHTIESTDVNEYLHEIAGEDITAKDFRTWHGTVRAAQALSDLGMFDSDSQAKHNVVEAIKAAAEHLGNTPAICRKSYVHPQVLDAYFDGTLLDAFELGTPKDAAAGLSLDEAIVLALLCKLEETR